jgi:tetratricopeptide (TPR) repeat protein
VEETPPSERDEAVRRLLDFLLATSVHAYRVLRPGHTVPALLPPAEHAGLRFADADAAGAWGERRIGAALEVVRQAAGALPARTADLLLALDPLLTAQHRWHDVAPVATEVADASARHGDARAEERARYMQGGALMQCSDGRATEVIAQALRLSQDSPDASVRAMILNVAAILRSHEGRDTEVVELLREAIGLARRMADECLEMLVLGNLAQTLLMQGVPGAEVLDVTDRQWELCERLGDTPSRSDVLYRRGQALRRLGRPEDALRSHLMALSYEGDSQQLLFRAANLLRAAEVCLDLHRHKEATRHAEQGVTLARELHHGRLEVLGNKVLGDALTATGNPAWGRVCWKLALARALPLQMTAEIDALRERLEGRSAPAPAPPIAG